jgi:predicted alpha/beta hydrolase family esterase
MSEATVLVLHGWGGNKPAHWQEHLVTALNATAASRSTTRRCRTRRRRTWRRGWRRWTRRSARSREGAPLTVVCHSLGAITWMHHAPRATRRLADRVLLVAPPYVMPGIPPTDAPPGVEGFFPPPMDADAIARAAGETHIIATDTDDYATFEQSKAYADRLRVPIHLLAGAGHISPYWGYGEWPWVRDWCLGKADLPPQPRPAD